MKNLKNKFSPIIITATILVVLGFVVAFLIINNYYTWSNGSIQFLEYENGIRKSPSIQDLGNVLAGTVGILFSLAGIAFFAYTIYQTKEELALNRKEMELTREAMELQRQEMAGTKEIFTTQLFESTFWNLLDNHKENILGDPTRISELGDGVNYYKAVFKDFAEELKGNHFSSPEITLKQPKFAYQKKKNFQEIGKSIIHIAQHINQLPQEKRTFYHNTFILNLSENEKFVIGMILNHKLESGISELPLSYEMTFIENSSYISPEVNGSFPPINFKTSLINFFTPDIKDGILNQVLAEEQTRLNIFPPGQNLFIINLLFVFKGVREENPVIRNYNLRDSKTTLSYILLDKEFIETLTTDTKVEVAFTGEYSFSGKVFYIDYNFTAELFSTVKGTHNPSVPPADKWHEKLGDNLFYVKFNFLGT